VSERRRNAGAAIIAVESLR